MNNIKICAKCYTNGWKYRRLIYIVRKQKKTKTNNKKTEKGKKKREKRNYSEQLKKKGNM